MSDPTASLTIVGTPSLTFSGVEDGNPLGLISMNEPPLQARATYADDSPHVEGSLPTQAVWQLSMINAVVSLGADTASELEARKQELRDLLAQFSYTAIQLINGTTRSWSAHMGSMALADGEYDFINLAEFTEDYAITIPVQPRSI